MFKFISQLPKVCKINLPFFLLFLKSNLCSWPIFFYNFCLRRHFGCKMLYIYIYIYIYICKCMYIYTIYTIYILNIYICVYVCIYIYILYIYYIYTIYIYILFFSDRGNSIKFKIEGRKGLPIFKRNLTRLMDSCCHIKICQHNCFLLIVLILLKMIILNRLENFEIWNRWLTECTNLQESKILLLFWEVIFWFVAQLIFPFA